MRRSTHLFHSAFFLSCVLLKVSVESRLTIRWPLEVDVNVSGFTSKWGVIVCLGSVPGVVRLIHPVGDGGQSAAAGSQDRATCLPEVPRTNPWRASQEISRSDSG